MIDIEILACDADGALSAWLSDQLETVDVQIGPGDTTLVVLSEAALRDPAWRAGLAARPTTRLVPIRLGPVDADAVPERVAELNWLTIDPSGAWLTQLISVLSFVPETYRLAQQVSIESRSWAASGHASTMLLREPSRVKELQELLASGEARTGVAFDPREIEFLTRSIDSSRRARRRQRLRTIVGVAAIVVAVLIGAVAVEAAQQFQATNRASIGLGESGELNRVLPKWAATNSGALLVEGDTEQQAIARDRLRELLGVPWPQFGADVPGGSFESVVPAVTPEENLLVHRVGDETSLVLYDRRSSQEVGRISNGMTFYSVSHFDGAALVSGPDGVARVDLATSASTMLTDAPTRDAWQGSSGSSGSFGTLGEEATMFHESDGTIAETIEVAFDDVVSTRAVAGGSPAVVLMDDDRYRFESMSADDFRIDVEPPELGRQAAVDPTGNAVFVTGRDGQVWRTDGTTPEPTGIPVGATTNGLFALAGDRLVVSSLNTGVQVYDTRTGQRIGAICTRSRGLVYITFSDDGDTVACVGRTTHEMWPVPHVPAESPPASATQSGEVLTVDDDGREFSVTIDGDAQTLGYRWPIVSAVSSHSGATLIVGDEAGRIAAYVRRPDSTLFLPSLVTELPDRGELLDVVEDGEDIWVETASGWWQLPSCPRCSTDEGLINAIASKNLGCWTKGQREFMSRSFFTGLGLTECSG